MINKNLLVLLFTVFCNLYPAEQAIFTPESLLYNPVLFLQCNKGSTDSFKEQCTSLAQTKHLVLRDYVDQIIDIASKAKQANPFFLIQECTDSACPLSRWNYPHLREIFENKASTLLKKQMDKLPDTAIDYTSFYPGNALPELMIITKALIKRPNSSLNIHLIDEKYTEAIRTRLSLTEKTSDNIKSIILAYIKCRDTKRRTSIFEDLFNILCTEMQHQQFMSWFEYNFPDAKVSLYTYQSVDEYLEYNEQSPAHVISTIDPCIKDRNILSDYYYLCWKTLKLHPTADNIALLAYEFPSVSLLRLAFDETEENSEKFVFRYQNQRWEISKIIKLLTMNNMGDTVTPTA